MNIQIEGMRLQTPNPKKVVAQFHIRYEGVLIRDLGLKLAEDGEVFMLMPLARSTGGTRLVKVEDPHVRNVWRRRAVAAYCAMTGYDPSKANGTHPISDIAVEDDDAGMRRVIGETMEKAGL